MALTHKISKFLDYNGSDYRFIYFLIGLTVLAAFLSIFGSQTYGTYFYWSILALLFAFNLLESRYWESFLVLTAALATLSVFQAGVIIGYRSWYYITIITAVFLSFKFNYRYFSSPGFRWWFLLLLLGMFHLIFVQSESAFDFAKGAVLQIGVGLSAFAIAYQTSRVREYREAISQLSFLIMSVCVVSLLVPMYLGIDESLRLAVGIMMDANGIGITAVYAFVAMLCFMLDDKRKPNTVIIVSVTSFLSVVLIRTASRQAIISILLALGTFIVMTFRQKLIMNKILVVLGILLSISYLVSAAQLSYVQGRFAKTIGSEGKIDRLDHLIISLYMVADHPLGLGGGGFKDNFNEYKYKAGIESIYTNINPHTLFGMVIADWGMPGFLLLLAGFITIGQHIAKLRGLSFNVKALILITYLILANAGMSFLPICMIFLGMYDS